MAAFRTRQPRAALAAACAAALWVAGLSASPVLAETDGAPAVLRPVLALPAERGSWRSRSQPVFDPGAQALVRKLYTVWDPRPSRGLDFTWIPDDPASAAAERVTGHGRLVWRLSGKPSYDPTSIQAEYRGRMVGGRPHGRGEYRERDGLTYEGLWVAGVPAGTGTMRLGSGAEYAGPFAAGAAHGEGRFYDVDGEVFEGRFHAGLRSGRGRTRLPGGGAYQSEWVAGEEVPQSRRLRLAQLGPGAAANDDVRLGITVDRVADPTLLQYATSQSESGLLIRPGNPRLIGLWKGTDEIQLTDREENVTERGSYGVFAYSAGDMPPLTLVFEVQNRAAAPVRVRGAYLDVDASVTDLQPAIQISAGSSGECSARARPDFSPRFELENFGWGPAEAAKLRFSFVAPRSNPGGATTTKDVGSIRAVSKLDFEPELRAAGVKTDILKRRGESGGIACKAKGNPGACLAEIVATGYFGTLGRLLRIEERDVFLHAAGSLDYTWTTQNGEARNRTSPFNVRLLLARTPVEAECGEGAEKEAVGKRPLEFRLDQTRYRLPVAFERTIRAGGTARYTVAVQAAKSSEHKFKVVLQTADGRQVASRPITLTYFRPSRLTDQYLNQ
ncbi:hypothetical protein [Enterovirga sp.]|uniref:hypothetical protein n=1 Tax=Enterovirga sp. TaxID=2026350 RepID=UPI00261CFF32|nr:hypothetical protein [Enterovirga sp.]MDB5589855.1 hypothetical protein [Enterovirga sp.]